MQPSDSNELRPRALRASAVTLALLLVAVPLGARNAADEWIVTTRLGERVLHTARVAVDERGRGAFDVPLPPDVAGVADESVFRFELEGRSAPWIELDVAIDDGTAHVVLSERDRAPIDREVAREAIAAFRARVAADGGELWGVALDGPVLLADPATRTVVADAPDPEGRLFPWGELWAGRLDDDVGVSNTALEWAGARWTMVAWPLPGAILPRDALLLHEAFHGVQPELGLEEPTPPCEHLGGFEGRLWLRLEARALRRALETSGEARRAAVADALAFRAFRYELIAEAAVLERAQERVEGTAEYTGLRLAYDDPAARRNTAVADLRALEARAALERSFAYLTGPALGLLLDDLRPAWRTECAEGAALDVLLARAVPLADDADLFELAYERGSIYGLDQVGDEETARLERRAERRAELRARFLDGPVLLVDGGDAEYTFDPLRVEVFEGLGTYQGTLWMAGPFGVLEADGGALVAPDGAVRLEAPESVDGALRGPGWTLTPAAGWTAVAVPGTDALRLTRDGSLPRPGPSLRRNAQRPGAGRRRRPSPPSRCDGNGG